MENDIASDCRRRKHVRFPLLAHDRLAAVCVDDVIQTRVDVAKNTFPSAIAGDESPSSGH